MCCCAQRIILNNNYALISCRQTNTEYARSLISQPFPICGIVRFCSKGCRVVIENRSLHTAVHTPIVT
ncbi:hypothetical protein HMPREF1587_01399 [Bifidobacterium breve JCP7499]|nr:hypothetical protein HMPREF1587_01399 [Bifidobacterium breve JCP7499]